MKKFALVLISFFLITSVNASNVKKSLVCTLEGARQTTSITIFLANQSEILPKIKFPFASDVTGFNFQNGNLLLVAMDHKEPSRLRIAISARYLMGTGNYEGQTIVDLGGQQVQFDNGSVTCVKN